MQDRSVVIPCCHDFDYRCINEWSNVNSNCPVCRTPMECIHYNILSMSSFSVASVIPIVSHDHDHDDYDDTEFDSDDEDTDDMDDESGTLSEEDYLYPYSPHDLIDLDDSSLMSLPMP